jgi:2-succinyl-5-enolpyruvyl-6-hydroxy-3-cyclohexene-1-carboxylate synthase
VLFLSIIISPGSRNAPLTIGFANDPFFNCYSIADERCAAFFALGIAQQLMQPVVVVCTSGSAVLNYYPAFAEAFYSLIPLIVISADRPTDKIDIGDGQTIRQANVFENHSFFNANLTEDANEANDLLINQAINIAIEQSGPVHINAPFEEPLYETTNALAREVSLLSASLAKETMAINDQEFVIDQWHKASKKLILVGTNFPNQFSEAVIEYLGSDPSVVVFTETTSNLHHPNFVHTIDTLITPYSKEAFEFLKPDILITFGGMVVLSATAVVPRPYLHCGEQWGRISHGCPHC